MNTVMYRACANRLCACGGRPTARRERAKARDGRRATRCPLTVGVGQTMSAHGLALQYDVSVTPRNVRNGSLPITFPTSTPSRRPVPRWASLHRTPRPHTRERPRLSQPPCSSGRPHWPRGSSHRRCRRRLSTLQPSARQPPRGMRSCLPRLRRAIFYSRVSLRCCSRSARRSTTTSWTSRMMRWMISPR